MAHDWKKSGTTVTTNHEGPFIGDEDILIKVFDTPGLNENKYEDGKYLYDMI